MFQNGRHNVGRVLHAPPLCTYGELYSDVNHSYPYTAQILLFCIV